MALSDDQRAMLRLLAQREEGYEDIAALKGMSVEEVRAEVKQALAQLAADRDAGLEPPAAPDRPEPVAPRPEEPAAPEPPKPEEPAKAPEPPSAVAEKVEATPSPASAAPTKKPARPRPSLRLSGPNVPPERRRLLALTGGAVAIVAVILIAIAIFSDGSDSSSPEPSASSGTEPTAAESGKVTQAVLEPADGSDASGRGIFGKIGKEEVVLQVTAENLKPTEKGQSYTVWLYRTPKLSLRVGSVAVDESGKLGARFPIPAELLAYVASGAFDQIYVSRTEDAAYQQEVVQAKKSKSLPSYLGETVLTGEITGPVSR